MRSSSKYKSQRRPCEDIDPYLLFVRTIHLQQQIVLGNSCGMKHYFHLKRVRMVSVSQTKVKQFTYTEDSDPERLILFVTPATVERVEWYQQQRCIVVWTCT